MRNGCVVPPLRRLISIAYAAQSPAASRTTTKSTANRPSTPSAASRSPIAIAGSLISREYAGSAGKRAAEVALAAGAAEQLVVRGQELDRAVGPGPQLHARAEQLLADDALLHDPAVGRELGRRTRRRARPCASSCMPRTRSAIAARRSGTGRSVIPSRSTSALPAPDTPSLSFTMTWRMVGRTVSRSTIAVDDLVEAVQVLGAERVGHSDLAEEPPAAGLAAELGEARVGAVHRDAEGEGDVALELGRVVGDEVAARPVRDRARRSSPAACGRSSSFSLSGRGDESPTESIESRASAWLGMTPGSSAR